VPLPYSAHVINTENMQPPDNIRGENMYSPTNIRAENMQSPDNIRGENMHVHLIFPYYMLY
jgi:hypothetical protein